MATACPVCHEVNNEILSGYKSRNSPFNNKKLIQCLGCGLVFINPMPSPEELRSYYENVWFKDEAIASTAPEVDLVYRIQSEERVKYLSRHINLSECKKVLDVGAGYGYLYDALKKREVAGLSFYATEHNSANLNRLRGKGIQVVADLDLIDEHSFDLVSLCFVLEHISEPCRFIQLIADRVKQGGYIFIDVPERDDTFKKVIEPHVVIFTEKSLRKLADKLDLRIIHLTGYGVERFKMVMELNPLICVGMKILRRIRKAWWCVKGDVVGGGAEARRIRELYEYYKFDSEGKGRWWIRVILMKK